MSECQHNWEGRCVDPGLPDCLLCKVEELKRQIEAVKNCEHYLCSFPDIGKEGAALRLRDVLAALEPGE
jgi:hypothetical protein